MTHRLLLQAALRPVQGERFQPTGFPDLGPAEFRSSLGSTTVLVESEQSMANRLESVIWSASRKDLVPALAGMPYLRLEDPQRGLITSLTEAHRMASAYLFPWVESALREELVTSGQREIEAFRAGPVIFRRDPNTLLHGAFFPKLKPILRLPRMLSAFIEAKRAGVARSGGVKRDRLDPSGEAEEGKGHVPFSRLAYTSPEIVAFFNLDLAGLRGYELSETAFQFMVDLAMYKIRRFLDVGLRLRSACDFMVEGLESTFDLPETTELESRLGEAIRALLASGELGPVGRLGG